MAVERDRPYAQFNFLVDLGTGSTSGPQAGFRECSEIGMTVDVIEYRNGNEKENAVRKLTGLAHYSNVTLKRGDHRLTRPVGVDRPGAERRPGRVPHRDDPAAERGPHRRLRRPGSSCARAPVRHVSGPFNAQCSDVAIEELTLTYERLELE